MNDLTEYTTKQVSIRQNNLRLGETLHHPNLKVIFTPVKGFWFGLETPAHLLSSFTFRGFRVFY